MKKNEKDLWGPVWGNFQGLLLNGKNKLQKSVYRMLYFVKEKKGKHVCTSAYCCKKKHKEKPKTTDNRYMEEAGKKGWKG